MKRKHKQPARPGNMTAPPSPDQPQSVIRARAFELYEQRGKAEGHELDDWLQAEVELLEKKSKAAGA